MINSLGYTVFPPRVSEVGKIQPFRRKIVFWSTLDAPSKKTVHLQELVMIYKVVVNNIVHGVYQIDRMKFPDFSRLYFLNLLRVQSLNGG